ncbi:MAG: class I SAM-dependent methyltransferase [Clostridiales Family XIII bacterium]|jgi:tRNA (adenine22-N1)-methyltransferase|nr:class I SAM-dependent methyltransferase [Clostridiales Family XIII bacterium]
MTEEIGVAKYTDRIKKLASYVSPGETVADIGPDHGYLGIWLVKNGISPRVIMTDIAEGPLAIARANAERYVAPLSCGKQSGAMDFRLGDGIAPLAPGEVGTVVIAGMGGETIIGILEADMGKTRSFLKYILQPRTKTELLRAWLNGSGGDQSEKPAGQERPPDKQPSLKIVAEDTVAERGRNCEIIVVTTATSMDSG